MSDNVQITVMGADVIQAQFNALTAKLQRATLRNALRRAVQQTLMKQARANLRAFGYAELARQVAESTSVTNTRAQSLVGSRRKTKLGRVSHLIEKGTAAHTINAGKRGKKQTGKKALADAGSGTIFGAHVEHPGASPRPWLAHAALTSQPETVKRFGEELNREIAKVVAKRGAA